MADMASDKKMTDMLLHMVADKEVDKVADMVAGHGCWLTGPNQSINQYIFRKCVN